MMLKFPDTAKALHKYISNKLLENNYPEEADFIAKTLITELLGLNNTDIVLDKKCDLLPKQEKELELAVIRLAGDEPLQYILKNTHFYGSDFYVDQNVLIPRPETEELVDWIKMSCPSPKRILDIGTGSGCIAISLAKVFPEARVTAIEVETRALEVARKNAGNLGVEIEFLHHDILKMEELSHSFDIIVSNPPYVPDADKKEMAENVLKNEPATALFVSDDDPLIFYKKIVRLATKSLTEVGTLFFEIHEKKGEEMMTLMKNSGFKNVALKKDMQGKDRMIKGNK